MLKRALNVVLVAGLVLGGPSLALAQPAPAGASAQPIVTVLADGVQVEWFAPAPELNAQPNGTMQVRLAGYATLTQAGLPRVPVAATLLALPPGAQPEIDIEAVDDYLQPLSALLEIAPKPQGVARDEAGRIIGGAFSPSAALPFQSQTVELTELGVVRGVRLARLTFYPVRPESGGLRLTTHVQVLVRFNSPSLAQEQSVVDADALVEALRSVVANPQHIQAARAAMAFGPDATQTASPRVLISVNATGLTQITHNALQAGGFPVGSVNPVNLHLTRGGVEIAMEWDGDGDELFEASERLLFFAAPRFSRWTANDGYVLSAETTPGLRLASRSANPSGLPAASAWVDQTVEANAIYTPNYYRAPIPPGRDGDRWVWDDLTQPGRPTATYNFSVPPGNAARSALLTVWLIGNTDVAAALDHRIVVALNTQTLGTVEWDGKQAVTATLPVTAGVLLSGSNALKLTLPGLPGVAVEGAWLDAFALNYAADLQTPVSRLHFETMPKQRLAASSAITLPMRLYLPLVIKDFTPAVAYTVRFSVVGPYRAYDVTDASQPMRLTDVNIAGNMLSFGTAMDQARRYAAVGEGGVLNPVSVRVPASLQSTTGADYIIITPATFSSTLSNLIALRQSQGLTVTVENVQAIYDTYDDGRPTPDAIRAYLADAYANWTPRPTYVLLVGDGTSDPKRYRSDSFITYLPPYLAEVDPWAGETAADNRFVTLDGNDALPDMLIGRLPVNSLTETQTVVDKIVQYETWPAVGGWNAHIAFAAENADSAGDFAADSDLLASAYITAPYTAQPLYFIPPTTTITATRQGIMSRWNGGAGLIFYTGHSSIHQWGLDEATGQPLFHLNDVAGLWNNVRQPVVMELTCFTGAFQTPGLSVMDEALVRRAEGGAVAVWGPTGLGVATGHTKLAEGFLESLFQNNTVEVGRAALAGKLRLALSATAPDLLDTFTLLGDPATRYNLDIVAGYPLYLPLVHR